MKSSRLRGNDEWDSCLRRNDEYIMMNPARVFRASAEPFANHP